MVEKTKQHTNDFYYTYEQFCKAVKNISQQIKSRNKKYRNIYAIPRGGLVLGVYLSHELNLPLARDTIMEDTLIVDDICDTGETMKLFAYNDKVTLVGKPKGLNKMSNIIYDVEVDDNTWVHFPWEKQEKENKERQVKLNDYI